MMWQPVELEEVRVRSVGASQFDYLIPQSGTRTDSTERKSTSGLSRTPPDESEIECSRSPIEP
jgi:hypothetical protein